MSGLLEGVSMKIPRPTPYRDLDLGRRLRDDGMARALGGADDEYETYKDAYRREFEAAVLRGLPFVSEDITERIGMPPPGKSNAIGALFNACKRTELGRQLEVVGWVQMQRPGAHARLTRQYQRLHS